MSGLASLETTRILDDMAREFARIDAREALVPPSDMRCRCGWNAERTYYNGAEGIASYRCTNPACEAVTAITCPVTR